MTSYNRVNQTFAAENSYLINGLLKGQLDFQGVAMTDWACVIGVSPFMSENENKHLTAQHIIFFGILHTVLKQEASTLH